MLARCKSRTLAGATAAVVLLALICASAHQAGAAHGYCSEHGKTVHVPNGVELPVRCTDRGAFHADTYLQGVHSCLELAFLAQITTVVPRGPTSTVRLELEAQRPEHRWTVFAAAPLWLQSPKTSPPLAGRSRGAVATVARGRASIAV
jgi:hypothetical protein